MPLIQKSIKSLGYEPTDERLIAEDIEQIITAVNALEGGSDYTETIVNISSAQILAMGTTPIELLPAAGAGKYYDIDKVVIEYTHVSTAYTSNYIMLINDGGNPLSYSQFSNSNSFVELTLNQTFVDVVEGVGLSQMNTLNQALVLTTYDGVSPTLGDGTMRVKIYHKTITFGA
jgi:uncharacterized protein YegL